MVRPPALTEHEGFSEIARVRRVCLIQCMAEFLLKVLPTPEGMNEYMSTNYPEADPISLSTHIFMRIAGTTVEGLIEGYLAKEGISSGRYLLMTLLELAPEGMKPSELSANLGVTQATITGLLDGLQTSGYTLRRDHAGDRRACVASLTDKGQEFVKRVRPAFNKWVAGLYDEALTTEEKVQLRSLLSKFLNSLEKTKEAHGSNR